MIGKILIWFIRIVLFLAITMIMILIFAGIGKVTGLFTITFNYTDILIPIATSIGVLAIFVIAFLIDLSHNS